jgi:hypothetical protein
MEAQSETTGGPLKQKPRESLSESKGILKDKELNKRGKNSSTAQKQKIERINPVIQKFQPLNSANNKDESDMKLSPRKNDSKDKDRQVAPVSSQKNLIKKKSQSPKTKKETMPDMVFNNMNPHSRRPVKSSN